MLYALFGVPLMLMCLSSLGGFLADALQCTYSKLCRTRDGNNENEMHECTQEEDEVSSYIYDYSKSVQSYFKIKLNYCGCVYLRNMMFKLRVDIIKCFGIYNIMELKWVRYEHISIFVMILTKSLWHKVIYWETCVWTFWNKTAEWNTSAKRKFVLI